MKQKFSRKKIIQLILLVVLILGITYLQNKNTSEEIPQETSELNLEETSSIEKLTDEKRVIEYLKKHKQLPDYYLTKNQARQQGWEAVKGNLCEVLPGKAIGGDYFGNREGLLPKKSGRKYFEADINYDCGRRGADRLVYSNDGLIFTSKDHYKSFQKH